MSKVELVDREGFTWREIFTLIPPTYALRYP